MGRKRRPVRSRPITLLCERRPTSQARDATWNCAWHTAQLIPSMYVDAVNGVDKVWMAQLREEWPNNSK